MHQALRVAVAKLLTVPSVIGAAESVLGEGYVSFEVIGPADQERDTTSCTTHLSAAACDRPCCCILLPFPLPSSHFRLQRWRRGLCSRSDGIALSHPFTPSERFRWLCSVCLVGWRGDRRQRDRPDVPVSARSWC